MNGATKYIIDGMFLILIGTFGWIANKADTKVEQHETRITANEMATVRIETKLDYLVKSMDEIKSEMKRGKP